MNINDYKDPIVSQWNKYAEIVENEPHVVTSGMFALTGLPDIQQRVVINGYVEIGDKDKIESSDEFKVDYTNGYVFMHSSKEGETINVTKYANRGVNLYPGSRVWLRLNNLGEVTETLDDLTDSISNLENRIDTGNTLKGELDNRIIEGKTLKGQLDSNILTGSSLKTDLDSRISTSTTKRQELDTSINTANTTKGNLDGSISTGNTLKVQLDSNMLRGGTLKTDLDGRISTATTRRNELDNKIPIATTKRDELDNRISLSEVAIGNTINAQQTLEDMIADIDGSDPFTQKFIATANQDTFTLTLGKYKNIDMMLVYIQGVLLEPLTDFTTVGDGNFNKIKISEKLPLGTEVVVKVLQTVPIWAGTTILP